MKNTPVQPLERDPDGTIRFRSNKIVKFLLDAGPWDMGFIAKLPVSDEERRQFAQLIGYSLCGYGDLSYVRDEDYAEAESSVDPA